MAKSLGDNSNVYIFEQLDSFQPELGVFSPETDKELVAAMADNYPEIIDWTVIGKHTWKWQYEEKPFDEGPFTISVTPAFTKFITIPMEVGCLDSVLAHYNAIAITRTYANQIFPGEDPIGKSINGEQRGCYVDENGIEYRENRTFVIEGIIDDKFHSFLNIRAIFSRSEDNVRTVPHADCFCGLVKLQEGILPDDFLKKVFANPDLLSKVFDTDEIEEFLIETKIRLRKLSDIYFELPDDKESLFKSRDKNTLIIGVTIALIVLIISAFNYVNITLIRAPKRLKNLAGQRILGASKRELNTQVILETFLHVLVSFGCALLFMPYGMQLFNSFMGSKLVWQDVIIWNNLLYIMGLLCILVFIPATYLLTKFSIKKPMIVFKNPAGNKIHYLGSLVILQMIISVILIAFSINVKRQMDYITSTVSQAHQIICMESDGWWMSQDFIDHIKQSATTTEYLPGAIQANTRTTDGKDNTYLYRETKPNYFDFLGIPIVMGHTFDNTPTDIKQIVANKSFIRSKEIEGNPLGYEFSIRDDKYRIVGVCEDFSAENATLIVPPVFYTFAPHEFYGRLNFNIRFQGTLEDKINEIKEIFEKYAVKDEYDDGVFMPKIYTMADYYINMNPEVKRLKIMVEFFAFISIFLSAIGLFGLSWYTVERRQKEMALRKVHGASTGKLLLLLCKTFFIWCAVATVIALPIGYYISNYWLERFVYRINNSLWTLFITALIAATVTFVTVIFQTARVARANPAKFIKME